MDVWMKGKGGPCDPVWKSGTGAHQHHHSVACYGELDVQFDWIQWAKFSLLLSLSPSSLDGMEWVFVNVCLYHHHRLTPSSSS